MVRERLRIFERMKFIEEIYEVNVKLLCISRGSFALAKWRRNKKVGRKVLHLALIKHEKFSSFVPL